MFLYIFQCAVWSTNSPARDGIGSFQGLSPPKILHHQMQNQAFPVSDPAQSEGNTTDNSLKSLPFRDHWKVSSYRRILRISPVRVFRIHK